MRHILIMAAAAVAVAFTGCGGHEPVTRVLLPDSTQIGRSLPVVTGSLAKHIEIPTAAYVLDLQDSIPRLTIRVRVAEPKESSSLINSVILTDSTYVTLVDSLGRDLPQGIVLRPDTTQLKTLNQLLETEGVNAELTFTGEPITEGYKDTLAMQARNFHLQGAIGVSLNESDIEALLKEWARNLSVINQCVVPPAMVPGMYIVTYKNAFDRANLLRRMLDNCKNLMNEEQKATFYSLSKRTPRRSLV